MLPIGASVGPAGLPVMPYDLSFTGGFFQIADFMQSLDSMVQMKKALVDVRGRLLTIDGSTLTPTDSGPTATPNLTAQLTITTFVSPADQGITAGATPTDPAPVTAAPISTTETSSATPTATATSTPTAP